jgi:hypothetical protein
MCESAFRVPIVLSAFIGRSHTMCCLHLCAAHAHTHKLKLAFIVKPPPQTPVFKRVARAVVQISYKNQKTRKWNRNFSDAGFFQWFLVFVGFAGDPTAYLFRFSWLVGTVLYLVAGLINVIKV